MSENPFDESNDAPIQTNRSGNQLNIWKGFQSVITIAVIVATLLTMWTPSNIFSNQSFDEMVSRIQARQTPIQSWPTITPAPRPKIGIVAGHFGNDSGAVCPDGLKEVEVNLRIASMVQQNLDKEGFSVDVFQEFDKRLIQYQGLALVSIHNDSCVYINDESTGFKVAAAIGNSKEERAARLAACLKKKYEEVTNLSFRKNQVTDDMRNYHTFDEVNINTPAAIIETGFLNLDRQFLLDHTDLVAKGISDGILCYLFNESAPVEEFLPINQ